MKPKHIALSLTVSICTLFLLISSALAGSSPALSTGLESIAWPELAEHLTEQGRSLLQLDLCDCPDNIWEMEPSRVVAQVIENTFYLWKEYDIDTNVDKCICILMVKPEPGPLTAEQARVLLTGSMLWRHSFPGKEERIRFAGRKIAEQDRADYWRYG